MWMIPTLVLLIGPPGAQVLMGWLLYGGPRETGVAEPNRPKLLFFHLTTISCPSQFFACLGATQFSGYIWRKPHYEHAVKVSSLSDSGPHRNPQKTLWTIQIHLHDLTCSWKPILAPRIRQSPPNGLKIGGILFGPSPQVMHFKITGPHNLDRDDHRCCLGSQSSHLYLACNLLMPTISQP